MTNETITCKACGEQTHPLAVFPGGICLGCHEQTPAGSRVCTADELVAMWGGKVVR